MSSTGEFPFSVADQKALISAVLNSTLMEQFLFGIYTGVFAVAIYVYLHKENSTSLQNRLVTGVMIALYIITVLEISINWYYVNIVFCINGATRIATFIETIVSPIGVVLNVLNAAVQNCGFLLADGLLVWRCFNACGRSLWKFIPPMLLFLTETALLLCMTAIDGLISTQPTFLTPEKQVVFNRVNGAMYVSVAATSLVATFMIYRQIYTHTTRNSRSWNRYKHVVDALVQSAAVYSAAAVFQAIMGFLDTGAARLSKKALVVEYYANALSIMVTGLIPTLMVARLASRSKDNQTEEFSESVHIPSELLNQQFEPETGAGGASAVERTGSGRTTQESQQQDSDVTEVNRHADRPDDTPGRIV